MALGVEMMLKSLGLDPDEIKKSVAGIAQIMADLRDGQARIEAQNARILELLETQEQAHDGPHGKSELFAAPNGKAD